MPLETSCEFPLCPEELAHRIDIALPDWPLNCHAIACAIRDLVPVAGMRIARGHYDGPVSTTSRYRGGFEQHSWLELADGRILDPTRWALESPENPFIYLGVCDHYDDGGRAAAAMRPPLFPGAGPDLGDRILRLSPQDRHRLTQVLGLRENAPQSSVSDTLLRACRLDPSQLRAPGNLYGILRDTGFKAMIPLDSWQRVMAPDTLLCRQGANRSFTLPDRQIPQARELVCRLLTHFVSTELRGERLAADLDEHGIDPEDYHDALNAMRDDTDLPLKWFELEKQFILGIAIGDLLGRGFGNGLRVERYARSLGYDRDALHLALLEVVEPFGLDCGWS